jgi:predicted amidohydrolase
MSKRPIKIAMAQSQISAGVRENGREIRKLMRRARAGGAAIVLFPEGALSGCSSEGAVARSWRGLPCLPSTYGSMGQDDSSPPTA